MHRRREIAASFPFGGTGLHAGLAAGVAQAVLATCLWSSSALLISRLTVTYNVTPLHISVWRILLALPVVAVTIAIRRPARLTLPWQQVPVYAAFGLVGVTLSYVAWATSVKLNSAPVAAALGFSAPVFVIVGDRLFFGAGLRLTQLGAIGVNLLGCGLVAGIGSPGDLWRRPEGIVVGLSVGVAFAAYTLLGRATARTQRLEPLASLLYLFSFGGLGLLCWSVTADGAGAFQVHLPWQGWVLLAGLAIGPTVLANGLYNASLRSLPPTLASLCTSLEPVLVAVASAVLLSQALSPLRVLGIGLVVGAVVAMQLDVAVRRRGTTTGKREPVEGKAAEALS
jgi:drug/metabolite transporter, DME family